MSESTAKILEELGGYHLECRGEREVKVIFFDLQQWFTKYSMSINQIQKMDNR